MSSDSEGVMQGSGSMDEAITLAKQHFEAGRTREAAVLCHQLVEAMPEHADAWLLAARISSAMGQHQGTVALVERAIDLDPERVESLLLLGETLASQGLYEHSEEAYNVALRQDPENSDGYLGLCMLNLHRGDAASALENVEVALMMDPSRAELHFQQGRVLWHQARFGGALSGFEAAVKRQPDHLNALINRAELRLVMGNYERGWQEYAQAMSRRDGRSTEMTPLPTGDLTGRHLLLDRVEGFGDELLFLRFARQLHERGAKLTYRVGDKIASMVARLPFIDQTIPAGENLPAGEPVWPLYQLPALMGVHTPEDIPSPVALTADADRIEAMGHILSGFGEGPYIGVSWRAGVPGVSDKRFSLERLAELLKDIDATVISLQRDPQADELTRFQEILGRNLFDLSPLNENLEDMLALLTQLDDVVGVSNTNMHLRAGIGKGARVLVPNPALWRWLVNGDSPWFPGFSIYRQGVDVQWDTAIEKLGNDLKAAWGT